MKESLNPSFDSISPSAKSLLLTKALTTIPYAREAARLIFGDKTIQYAQGKLLSIGFLLRLFHFEKRYWSVDNALTEIGIKNIFEFSSGFSFRGLSLCKDSGVCYIDTDLPQIIEINEIIIEELTKKFCKYLTDNLFLSALDVLDGNTFAEITSGFSAGPIAIVNERFLVYLGEAQKRNLCTIIHDILSKREGIWITADIYTKKEMQNAVIEDFYDERGKRFLADRNVEENEFKSFKEAETFFKKCGFDIHKKIETSTAQLNSIKLLRKIPNLKIGDLKGRKKTRETWILKTKD